MSASDASPSADRNLLFGILALQMDFVSRDALIKAMNAWVLQKSTPLGQILLDQGALRADTHALLDALVQKHLEMHGGDAQKSLASVSSLGSARQQLEQIADADLHQSLAHVAANRAPEDDPFATRTATVGESTSAGQRFRILRPHARGGLGEVFVAHDSELGREVALKEIQDRFADDQNSRSRFVLEAEITGGLEHPGIVPVYGLGQYADGRPFYAMRFIRGDSLQDAIARFHHADTPNRDAGERSLSLRQLLGRFVDVCDAIDYAHSRRVLHRDLKPGNIMLGKFGETLVVDWGLAKPQGHIHDMTEAPEGPLQPSSASGSAPTQMGRAIGTPAYMSPEQAAGQMDQLGPASDVYSLGATLYALLTGKAPFSGQDHGEILRRVQQGEFPPPRQIKATVPAALEAVCLKAMANEPEDRYDSARVLARDIEHWLADEPVSAWREPWQIRARRWVGRHRTSVTTAAATLLVATVSLTAATLLLQAANRRERQARDAEVEQRKRAEEQKKRAEDNAEKAEKSQADTKAVLEYFQNKVLSAGRPKDQEGGLGREVTLREAVDKAEADIADSFKDRPLVEASIRNALGTTYYYLGESDLAIRQHEQATSLREIQLGADHPETLTARNNLAAAYWSASRFGDAIRLLEQTLKQCEAKLGPDHPDTLISRNGLAATYADAGRTADAIRLHEQNLKQCEAKLGPDHLDTLNSRNGLAVAYVDAGRFAEAIRLHEQTLKQREAKLGPDHPSTLTSRNNLALAFEMAGRTAEAILLYEQTLKQREAKLGPNHPDTLLCRNNLANAYRSAGRNGDAIRLFEQTLKQKEVKLGPEHPDTLTTRNDLALAYWSARRIADATRLFEQTLKQTEAEFGADHRRTLTTRNNLALAYESAGRFTDAIRLHEQTLKQRVAKLGPDHPDTLQSRNNLAVAYKNAGRFDEAIRLYEQTLKQREAKLGADHPHTLLSMANLGAAYRDTGRLKESITLLETAIQRGQQLPDGLPAIIAWVPGSLAQSYEKAGQFAKAETLSRDSLEQMQQTFGSDDPRTARALVRLGNNLLKQKKFSEADPLLRQCLAIRENKQSDEWTTFNTRSVLGEALVGQKKYAEAEPLLLQGYEGMKEHQDKIAPAYRQLRLSEGLERLVQLYDAWSKKDKADDYRKKLAAEREKSAAKKK